MAALHPARLVALTEATVVLQRYTRDITDIAGRTLGPDGGDNRDIQVLLAVHRRGPCSITALQDALGLPRSTMGRAVRALSGRGLVEGREDPGDGRRVLLETTARGRQRIDDFDHALGGYFTRAGPQLTWALGLLGHKRAAAPGAARPPRTALQAAEAMARAGADYAVDVTTALSPFGIRRQDERYAVFLLHAHRDMRPAVLAEELGMSRSSTSGLLRRLERAELAQVDRVGRGGDGRGMTVVLTARGKVAATTALTILDAHSQAIGQALALTLS